MTIKFPEVLRSPDGAVGGGASSAGTASSPSASPAPSSDGGQAPSSAPSGEASSSPSGGGNTTPTPTPEPTPSGTPSPEPLGDDFLAGLGGDLDDEDLSAFGQPEPTPAVQPEPPPPQQAAPPVAPEPAPPAQPEPTPAPATGPQEAQASIPSPAEPALIAKAMQQNAEAIIDHLAQNEFQLSQEEIEALETDVRSTIPKILARTFLKAQMSTLNQLQRVVPAMLQAMTKVQKANQENESKFYSRWPDIKADKHGDIVRRIAQVYRQMNPEASLEQMVEDVGPMVMVQAKIQPAAPKANGAGNSSPGGFRPPPSSPFKPAVGGAASPQPIPDENPWMGLGGSHDEE